MALGSKIKKSFNHRQLWNELIEMKLLDEDGVSPSESMKEFYDTMKQYKVPDALINPCREAFLQQKWLKDRASKKASGLFVPQPRLARDRFTGHLTDDRLARKSFDSATINQY